uniref:Uncharacterized protein n=1 Tax=Rhizophora mucronata TaxID=61149 RepID=A0A2P2JEY0_RHIMU
MKIAKAKSTCYSNLLLDNKNRVLTMMNTVAADTSKKSPLYSPSTMATHYEQFGFELVSCFTNSHFGIPGLCQCLCNNPMISTNVFGCLQQSQGRLLLIF